jgi:hypothetical protein
LGCICFHTTSLVDPSHTSGLRTLSASKMGHPVDHP